MKYKIYVLVLVQLICNAYNPAQDTILLIVNYNWPYYKTIPYIKEFYGRYFPHMVVYGKFQKEGVHHVPGYHWYFAYRVIADAMKKYPEYDGYLFINDDCMLNTWNFERLDPSKIWFVPLNIVQMHDSLTKKYGGWWWKYPMGLPALRTCIKYLPENYRKQWIDSLGEGNTTWGYADVLYIPQRLRRKFLFLSQFFFKHKVFLEIAVSNICACLESQDTWEQLNGIYLWEKDRSKVFEKYTNACDFIHPVKLTKKENINFVRKKMASNKIITL